MVVVHIAAAWIGIVGMTISALAYLINARGKSGTVVMGMALLVVGYSLLVAGEVEELVGADRKKESTDGADAEEHRQPHGSLNGYAIAGYVFVFLFFAGIHVFPQLTINVRYYDAFAAIGAFLRIVPNSLMAIVPNSLMAIVPNSLMAIVPNSLMAIAGAASLAAYYLMGSVPKLLAFARGGGGVVDRMQMISRPILVLYYLLVIAATGSLLFSMLEEEEFEEEFDGSRALCTNRDGLTR
jgi:hypothetical protein